ncbi:MAG: 30S ribosomal protein S16 [Bacteroidota bacterium]
MAVKIRLARRGRKKQAMYDVVVADARAPRDGRFIEKLGRYNPNTNPASIELNDEGAFAWVMKGAQPTDTVRAILSYRGIMLKKHLQVGVNKGAITQEEADKRFDEWKAAKDTQIENKKSSLAKSAADSAQARKEAETKIKEERAAALKKREEEAIAAVEAAEAEAAGEAADAETAEESESVEETPTAEETPAEENKTEE